MQASLRGITDHLSQAFAKAPVETHEQPHAFVLGNANDIDRYRLSEKEQSVCLRSGGNDLLTHAVDFETQYNSLVDLIEKYTDHRQFYFEKLPASCFVGGTLILDNDQKQQFERYRTELNGLIEALRADLGPAQVTGDKLRVSAVRKFKRHLWISIC